MPHNQSGFQIKLVNISGDIYQTVINKERKGEYNGGTVQVIPHITNEIKKRFVAFDKQVDITIIEIGGTIGDIEGLPFIEATRQFMLEQKREDIMIFFTEPKKKFLLKPIITFNYYCIYSQNCQ